jgi:hypothetical protein
MTDATGATNQRCNRPAVVTASFDAVSNVYVGSVYGQTVMRGSDRTGRRQPATTGSPAAPERTIFAVAPAMTA